MVAIWVDLSDPSAAQIEAAAVVAQTVLLVGALIFTYRQLKAARDVREATERPFVVIEVVPGDAHSMLDLVITNHGPVIARDVQFSFDPPLTSDIADGIADFEMLSRGIPTLAPSRSIVTLFDSLIHRKVEEHPDVIDVVVRYRGEGGRTYEEPMRIDVGIFRRVMTVTRHTVHDVHKELEKLRKVAERWTAGPGFGRGILTRSDADVQREVDEWHAQHERVSRADLIKDSGVDVDGLPEDEPPPTS